MTISPITKTRKTSCSMICLRSPDGSPARRWTEGLRWALGRRIPIPTFERPSASLPDRDALISRPPESVVAMAFNCSSQCEKVRPAKHFFLPNVLSQAALGQECRERRGRSLDATRPEDSIAQRTQPRPSRVAGVLLVDQRPQLALGPRRWEPRRTTLRTPYRASAHRSILRPRVLARRRHRGCWEERSTASRETRRTCDRRIATFGRARASGCQNTRARATPYPTRRSPRRPQP